MSQALYRKYRPASFIDLIGQNSIRVTLMNELENSRVSHAYLFSGPRGVGKTTTARLLAKAVNCPNRKGAEPCNKCDFCREFGEGRSMDLIEIDAASHTGVDNVRENIIENSRFTPQRAKYKVFIIDEVHMLSLSAFNALLKTLEEPPEHVIFILATTEIHRVPETIISRCQRFDFKRLSVDNLTKRLRHLAQLEKITVEESLLKNIARRAEGSVRDAEVLLGQIMALGGKHITEDEASLVIPRSNLNLILEFFRYLALSDGPAAIAMINKLIDEGVSLQDFTKELVEFLRKVLLFKVSGSWQELEELALDEKAVKEIQSQSSSLTISRLVLMIEKIINRANELKYSQIMQLPLELAVLELCQLSHKNEIPSSPSISAGQNKPVSDQRFKDTGRTEDKKKTVKSAIFDKIKEVWPQVAAKLKTHNHSISLSLKSGAPVAVEDGMLTIGFLYKFHAERVKEHKVSQKIEEVIEKLTGHKLRLKTAVLTAEEFNQLSKLEPERIAEKDIWNDALQSFGGEVIEE